MLLDKGKDCEALSLLYKNFSKNLLTKWEIYGKIL